MTIKLPIKKIKNKKTIVSKLFGIFPYFFETALKFQGESK